MSPSFFTDNYGINQSDLETLLSTALATGGDYADLFFESRTNDVLTFEENILKNASKSISRGVGIRVIAGEKTGYAYCDGFEMNDMTRAARTAAAIALGSRAGSTPPAPVAATAATHDLYRVAQPLVDIELPRKLDLLQEANRTARSYDSRIVEVRIILANENKQVMIYSSTGDVVCDVRPLTVLQISCIAHEKGERQIGTTGGGGRAGLEFFECAPRRSLRARRLVRPSFSSGQSRRPPVRCRWFWVRGGPASFFTKRSGMVSKRILTGKGSRHSRDG